MIFLIPILLIALAWAHERHVNAVTPEPTKGCRSEINRRLRMIVGAAAALALLRCSGRAPTEPRAASVAVTTPARGPVVPIPTPRATPRVVDPR